MDTAASGNNRSNSSVDLEDGPPVDQSKMPPIHNVEVNLVECALRMKTKFALDIYTPTRKIFAVPSDLVLGKDNITRIYSEGYSRIPVYLV